MSYVLKAEGLTKIYRIYKKPIDRLKEIVKGKKYHYEHVALKDVSIKLRYGEVLGVIGENGAGKSTLLSIIAGVVLPTKGYIEVRGRVAAILELGAGFHPDLSGYENVFLYSSLMGISKEETKKKMDFIEEFSELQGFLDKPIKTYSTGMIVRLAFSTILAIEPAVFIIDEALAVGDIHFQHKSFSALRDYIKKGGSIIFTSHSLYQITNICNRAIWLKQGQIVSEGDPLGVVKEYEDYMRRKNELTDKENTPAFIESKDIYAKIMNLYINKNLINPGEMVQINVEIYSKFSHNLHVGIVFKRNDGLWVSTYSTKHANIVINKMGRSMVTFTFEEFPILHGEYDVEVYLLDESASIIYDVKSSKISISKTSPIDLGVFKINGRIDVSNLD